MYNTSNVESPCGELCTHYIYRQMVSYEPHLLVLYVFSSLLLPFFLFSSSSQILQRELEMKKKMAGRSGRSAYEIARDKAESGEDDEDDDGTVSH